MRSMLHVLDKLVVMITYFEILSPYNIFISNCRNISLSGNTKCILNLSFFRKLLPIFLIFSRGLSFTNSSLSLSLSLSFHTFLQNIDSQKTTPWTRKVFVHMLSNFICMDNFVQQSVKNKFFSSPL